MNLGAFVTLADGLDHPEGVTVGPDGTIYAGGEAGQIYRIEDDGTTREIATTGGFLYGLAVDKTGTLFACDYGNACVQRVDTDGTVSVFSSGARDRPMQVPNFAAFDDAGSLYVTDSGTWGNDDGVVYRIASDGATSVWTDALPRFPNGCCVTADGADLLVVESRGRAVMRVPIQDDGSAGPPERIVDLSGSQPDGVTLAADGTLFVGCYRPDRVWRISPDGEAQIWVEDPDGVVLNQPANVAFFGDGSDRVVVSSLGGWSLVAADAGTKGLALRYPTP